MIVEAIPAFADNYIWVLRRGDQVAVVDPGDAAAVEHYLDRTGARLVAILITHHHGDHTGGIWCCRTGTVKAVGVVTTWVVF
ncbi:MAG: MBL fold metallo-hydrolase, partial [Casimicrobiaceae bacterium]